MENLGTITLDEAERVMDDVVVTGYLTQKKSDITSNIATIKGSEIVDKPVQSFDAALSGQASGVQITVANGVVNNPPVFHIRGVNSISLSSYPLIVIDGVPTFTDNQSQSFTAANPLSSINPNDIADITVLKDAAATAQYGSRAANGVVLITTKKGSRGKAKITYDGWVGWTSPYRLWKMLDASQYIMMKNEALQNAGIYQPNPALPNAAYFDTTIGANGQPINTNWQDYVYHTGLSHSHTLSIAGANEGTSYYLSANYTNQNGIIVKNSFERKSVRFNIDQKVSKIISAGLDLNYSDEMNRATSNTGSLSGDAFATGGLGRISLILPPNVSPYNNDGTYNIVAGALGPQNNWTATGYYNILTIINNDKSSSELSHIQSNAYVQIKPVQDIAIKTMYGIDNLDIDNNSYLNPYSGDAFPTGEAFSSYNRLRRWVWTTTAGYTHSFAKKHNLQVLAGTEQQASYNTSYGLDRTGVSDPYFTVIQGGWTTNNSIYTNGYYSQNYLVSGFGILNYNYEEKYAVSASWRRDGYSAFAVGHKYGDFWGVSAGWDIGKESFWKNSSVSRIINAFNLKGSYGTVGNISGIGDYASLGLYSGSLLYDGNPTLYYNQSANPNLTWETSKKTDVGFTFGLLNNVITGEFAYYYNNVNGLIINVPQSGSTGIPGLTIPQNIGSMYNRGEEITLNATPVNRGKFTWNTSFNISFNTNKVTALATGVSSIVTSTSGLETVNITLPGYPIGMLYVIPTAGVDPATGDRIFINSQGQKEIYNAVSKVYTNLDGTANSTSIVQVPYKSGIPKYYGGFDNKFKYGPFDLDLMLTYQGGFWVYNGTQASIRDQRAWNNSVDMLSRWQKPGDITDIPKVVYGDRVSNGSANPISDNVQKGDFIKFKNVSLGYTLPTPAMAKIGVTSARFYVAGQNLFIITGYKGPDPEVSSNGNSTSSQGVDRNTVANGRTLTLGVDVAF